MMPTLDNVADVVLKKRTHMAKVGWMKNGELYRDLMFGKNK